MKPDAYTKIVLTIIAVCLIWMCVKEINFTPPVQAQAAPQPNEIVGFQLGWNTQTNSGEVKFRPKNGQVVTQKVISVAELAGWAALLNQKPLYHDNRGMISTAGE